MPSTPLLHGPGAGLGVDQGLVDDPILEQIIEKIPEPFGGAIPAPAGNETGRYRRRSPRRRQTRRQTLVRTAQIQSRSYHPRPRYPTPERTRSARHGSNICVLATGDGHRWSVPVRSANWPVTTRPASGPMLRAGKNNGPSQIERSFRAAHADVAYERIQIPERLPAVACSRRRLAGASSGA